MSTAGNVHAPWWGPLLGVWRLRHFWLSLVMIDLRSRYRNSSLGLGWSLLRPLGMATILCLVFSKIFDMPLRDFGPYLLIGITTWQFITESILAGCGTFHRGAGYLRLKPLPLAIFPLRTTIGVGFHAGIALALAAGLTGLLRGISPLAPLHLLPGLVLLLALSWSVALLVGLLHTYFPDTEHLLEILLQLTFYLSPIIYPLEALAQRGRIMLAIRYNPVTYVLEVVRVPVLEGRFASPEAYLVVGGLTLLMGTAAVLALRRLGRRLVYWV